MNPLIAQQVALDDALVAPEDHVEIGKCNIRTDPTKTQKEAIYQVVLDTLSLSPCYNAFLITSDVPEIYMHQFWFTISKIKDSSSYQVPNQQFVEPPSHEDIVTFIKSLGYKGALKSIPDLFTDHMYQPWRTLVSITNKCISSKTTGVDKLRLSRAQILWGMFYKKNVDFVKLIWEDFMYQIDNIQTSVRRCESIPYPRFIKAIIYHFISKNKSIFMRNRLFMHSIKNDSVLGRLKFVAKNEDNQVNGMSIPDVMINKKIKNSKAYKTYLAFSTRTTIPKKARKGKKAAITPKKKSTFTADDNIIPDPDVALELGKSISKTEDEEHEEAKKVHETYGRLVTSKPISDEESNKSDVEPIKRPTGRRRQTRITFRDTSNVSKKKTPAQSQKLKEPNIRLVAQVKELVSHQSNSKALMKKTRVQRKMMLFSQNELNVEMKEAEIANEGKADEEMADKDKPDVHPSSSSLSVSSDYGTQFHNLFSDFSLAGITKESTDTKISSMLDIQIQQEITTVQSLTLLVVPQSTTIPKPSTTTKAPIITTTVHDLIPAVIQRLSNIENKFEAWSKTDHTEALKETVQINVLNKVMNQLPKLLLKAVSDFGDPRTESIAHDKKTKAAEPPTQKKRRHNDKDQDPPARSEQGIKKRIKIKDVELSKRLKSTSSSKGTRQSQPKSTGKSMQAEETVLAAADTDMPLNQGNDMGNTDKQPIVEVASKYDWFKKPPRPPTPDPEWNTRKLVDDGPNM
nr:hypothetical protein [Tanacetum cinerariifolium]